MESKRIRAIGGRSGRPVGAALLLSSALLLLTGCGPSDGAAGATNAAGAPKGAVSGGQSVTAAPSAAVLDVQPSDGAKNVAPNGALKVSVAGGKLTQVSVAGPDGKPVAGAVAADGLTWVPSTGLAVGTAYKVNAQAVDAHGVASTTTSGFTTLTPTKTAGLVDNIDGGGTYGVGMIISVDFHQAVVNKAAALAAITVETSDNTPVKGHWFSNDSRLDLRPETYWKPGTKVTIHYRTKSAELSPGVYGNVDKDESFTIGRSKISTVDAATHQMSVAEGGTTKNVAITAGADDNPSWNGTMVVFEKDRMVHMNSATTTIKGAPYDVTEPHGLKISDTGSYVHGNPKAVEAAGHENISHGCIGLPDTEAGDDSSVAGKFWADSMIGDVVIVNHSVGKQVAWDNGLGGWNAPWSAW
ncbi:L,D-transpeptidase [Kitasatospora mediocidica]|uniref:L,D-transpeptidase n=1 Tax=Kitasatospora mediocidica TaxID=58352 RepID=UPI00068A00B5|nr:Ig-like domain-containing protein [Kitasatospora mediocidica]